MFASNYGRSELRGKLLAKSTKTQASETEVFLVPSRASATNVTRNDREDAELAEAVEEICEEEFRTKFMPEDRGSDMAINFISMQAVSRDKAQIIEDMEKTFDKVESMIKGVFPQLLNLKDGKVGQALCTRDSFEARNSPCQTQSKTRAGSPTR